MDYAMPATALEGLLSGLGHPVIGVDHLLFIAGAGVLAARFKRGYLLPLAFVAAYLAGLTLIQSAIALSAWWIATWLATHRPRVPFQRLVGAAAAAARLGFPGLAAPPAPGG